MNKLHRNKIIDRKLIKPNRPYKNYNHYVLSSKGKCEHCYGSGRIVAPWACNDPVEGYKMADRIDCPDCRGTGKASVLQMREYYNKKTESFMKRYNEWKSDREKMKSALDKLTLEDAKILGLI